MEDLLSLPENKPTIGLLLCRSEDRTVVEHTWRANPRSSGAGDLQYALCGLKKPVGGGMENEDRHVLAQGVEGKLAQH